LDEALALQEDSWFAESRKIVIQWVEAALSGHDELYLFIHNTWVPHFKEVKQQEQGLDLLLLAFKDLLYYHLDYTESMAVFDPGGEMAEKAALVLSQEKLLAILHAI